MHLAYIWIVSHLSAKNYGNWWKFYEVLTKANLLIFFGTRCSSELAAVAMLNVSGKDHTLHDMQIGIATPCLD